MSSRRIFTDSLHKSRAAAAAEILFPSSSRRLLMQAETPIAPLNNISSSQKSTVPPWSPISLWATTYRTNALATSDFEWSTLESTERLSWTDCYSGFQCTLYREDYRGPILFNPGGPGGSGVDAVVSAGASIATLFGDEYDIVGFDPRVLGQLAETRDPNDYLQYITTDNVARDMLRITDAFGFDKLQYWGVSYGSALGATFATLFPDKVGRIIIDGVVDMEAYYSANMTNGMLDTDKTWQTFFDGCAAAGPDKCAFLRPTAAEIFDNFTALSLAIQQQPIPLRGVGGYSCGDSAAFNTSLSDLQEIYTAGKKVSSFADFSPPIGGSSARPVGAANTSTPLLIVGNTADPVTPLAGAIKTSKAFPGSVVLTQDSPGHTSTIAASLCTYGYFRQYFVNGTLPEAGTLFASSSDSVNVNLKRDTRDHELIEAVRNIGNVVRRVTSHRLRR
ncbi:Alpha/Beta hydrolase protein [Mycena sp. CBHHK59/15]|nr:Alpha/Beta hydrolase protein [Mycena sp. CBHHK59/15]